ncbi:MAG: LacI family transcriptional regulator [Streptococcaceae bacterium]|jgi:LacI family transcriptional regulator|nr:LacI family transcriptional regulator [Streptococcaceae bacterium]
MKKTTLKEIAVEAGVSAMTVSNVVHGKTEKVSADTIEKVSVLLKKYNYTINQNAAGLRGAKSRLIGLVYYSRENNIKFSNPFVARVLSGIEQVAKTNGYFVMVHAISKLDDLTLLQSNWKFAGFIAVGVTSEVFKRFDDLIQVPVCYIDAQVNDQDVDFIKHSFVQIDERSATQKLTSYVNALGHEHIAFVSYHFKDDTKSVLTERYKGYCDIVSKPVLIMVEEAEVPSMSDLPEEITAIVASSDTLALLLLNRFPEISVVGHDDIPMLNFINPGLTTVKIHQKTKGRIALSLLLELVDGNMGRVETLATELVKRESVKKLS